MTTTPPRPALFTLRTLVVLVVGVLVGLGAATLTYLVGHNPAGAALAGCAAFGASVVGVHQLLE